jgi:hypothetical protein
VLILNIPGGVILVVAVFCSLIISGRMAGGASGEAMHTLPYVCGGLFIVLDLTVRGFYRLRLRNAAPDPNIITRGEGATEAPRPPMQELLFSLFHPAAGGQYFYILPAWLVGVALIVAKCAGLLEGRGQ